MHKKTRTLIGAVVVAMLAMLACYGIEDVDTALGATSLAEIEVANLTYPADCDPADYPGSQRYHIFHWSHVGNVWTAYIEVVVYTTSDEPPPDLICIGVVQEQIQVTWSASD